MSLQGTLDTFLACYDFAAHRAQDPIAFPWRFADPNDREVIALVASALSYGRASLIARAMEDVLQRIGPTPAKTAENDDEAAARQRFDGFVYRLTRGVDLTRLWLGIGALRRQHQTLLQAFLAHEDGGETLRGPLTGFRNALLAPTAHFEPRRAVQHLLPDPRKGSACKRFNMFLRWMVRGPDAIDFGDWAVLGSHRLVMPLDTHIHRLGKYLGLTTRKAADWRTAEEVTAALRSLDSADPLRYDFALAHMGISGACPTRRVEAVCIDCPIRTVCRLDEAGLVTR